MISKPSGGTSFLFNVLCGITDSFGYLSSAVCPSFHQPLNTNEAFISNLTSFESPPVCKESPIFFLGAPLQIVPWCPQINP